jgi:hypothetical protein
MRENKINKKKLTMEIELINENELDSFFERMALLRPSDLNYNRIYNIDFCSNIFYYSKEQEDFLQEVLKIWSENESNLERRRLYYYHFLDKFITETIMHKPEDAPDKLS